MSELLITSKWEELPNPENPDSPWLEIRDPKGWFSATVKDVRCVDLHRYHNVPCTERTDEDHPQIIDYIHICDIDDLIERLQELKIRAKMHYGDDWG